MKSTRTVIPQKHRNAMAQDPLYAICAMKEMHTCEGRVTWEHALYAKGKKVQTPVGIVALCEGGHGCNFYLDAASVPKDMREWIALSRATEDQIRETYPKTLSMMLQRKRYLEGKYGVYKAPYIPEVDSRNEVQRMVDTNMNLLKDNISLQSKPLFIPKKKDPEAELEREARSYARANGCTVEEAAAVLKDLA